MANVKFVAPRVPLVDLRTGQITREWYLLFSALFTNTDDTGGIPDPTEDTASILFAAPDQRIDTLSQEAAIQLPQAIPASILSALEMQVVPVPVRDEHRRLDDLELLLAALGPVQAGQQPSAGNYTPTVTAGANVTTAALVGTRARWLRIGNMVAVAGALTSTNTAAGVASVVGISLPFAANFANSTDVTGNAATDRIQQSGAVDADTVNDRAQCRYIAADTSATSMFFNFTYEVL